jgi:hypothetical protein
MHDCTYLTKLRVRPRYVLGATEETYTQANTRNTQTHTKTHKHTHPPGQTPGAPTQPSKRCHCALWCPQCISTHRPRRGPTLSRLCVLWRSQTNDDEMVSVIKNLGHIVRSDVRGAFPLAGRVAILHVHVCFVMTTYRSLDQINAHTRNTHDTK